MRLIHTADWHLGRTFYECRLIEDQAHILDQFITLVREAAPDAVVIAGDIYDRAVPPADAVILLDEVLDRLVRALEVPVIAIAGNHDGPERLQFGSRILAGGRLHLAGLFRGLPEPVRLADADGAVDLYALPYAEPPVVRAGLGGGVLTDHDAAMAAVLEPLVAGMSARRPSRAVLVAHGFVAGGTESESERVLAVGGSGAIGIDRFDGFDYVALGHLHRPQSAGRPAVRYAGSLLKYSFDEASHAKSVSLVEMDRTGRVQVETIALSPRRDVRVLEGRLLDLLARPVADGRDDYLLVRLTDPGPVLDAMPRLRSLYPNALSIERTALVGGPGGAAGERRDHRRIEAIDLFGDFYHHVTGGTLAEAERAAAADAITLAGQTEGN